VAEDSDEVRYSQQAYQHITQHGNNSKTYTIGSISFLKSRGSVPFRTIPFLPVCLPIPLPFPPVPHVFFCPYVLLYFPATESVLEGLMPDSTVYNRTMSLILTPS